MDIRDPLDPDLALHQNRNHLSGQVNVIVKKMT